MERPDERVACDLMSKALGVAVDLHDDGSRPGMFDFKFEFDDGRLGAAEMTTITDGPTRAWRALRRRKPTISGSQLQWIVRRRGRDVRFGEVFRHLQTAALLMEARGLRDPRDLCATDPLLSNHSVQWLREARIDVCGFAASPENYGRVYPESDHAGSFVSDTLEPALQWLEGELVRNRYDGEFEKLERSGRAEQHLVLRLDLHGVPHDHFFALTDGAGTLPDRPPAIPGRHLTGLWLIPELGTELIWWTTRRAWQRLPVSSAA